MLNYFDKDSLKHDGFSKLAKSEEEVFSSQFICPVLNDSSIRIRIAGIILSLKIRRTKKFNQGWGVFKVKNFKEAVFVRSPSMSEKQAYLDLFKNIRIILCKKVDDNWYGIPLSKSDRRFTFFSDKEISFQQMKIGDIGKANNNIVIKINDKKLISMKNGQEAIKSPLVNVSNLIHVAFAEEVQLFDVVKTSFDGINYWFNSIDLNYNPKTAIYLREQLIGLKPVEELQYPGLTQEEKDAYLEAYAPVLVNDLESRRDKTEDKIKEAIERMGAVYHGYIERSNAYTVEFSIDGEKFKPTINKDDFNLQSAGICLSGGDTNFDLSSFVGVVIEGKERGRIHHF